MHRFDLTDGVLADDVLLPSQLRRRGSEPEYFALLRAVLLTAAEDLRHSGARRCSTN